VVVLAGGAGGFYIYKARKRRSSRSQRRQPKRPLSPPERIKPNYGDRADSDGVDQACRHQGRQTKSRYQSSRGYVKANRRQEAEDNKPAAKSTEPAKQPGHMSGIKSGIVLTLIQT